MEKIDDEQENKLDQQNSAIAKELIQQKEENNEYEFEVENKEEIQNKQEDDINDDYNSFVQIKNESEILSKTKSESSDGIEDAFSSSDSENAKKKQNQINKDSDNFSDQENQNEKPLETRDEELEAEPLKSDEMHQNEIQDIKFDSVPNEDFTKEDNAESNLEPKSLIQSEIDENKKDEEAQLLDEFKPIASPDLSNFVQLSMNSKEKNHQHQVMMI